MMILPKSVALGVFLLLIIFAAFTWYLSLQLYNDSRAIAGYAMGRAAERARNPAAEYIDSGAAFCYDGGEFHPVKRTGKTVFKVRK